MIKRKNELRNVEADNSENAINGYRLLTEFTTDNAGFCRWAFAEKNGHTYFIKQFLSPKYPLDTQELTQKSRRKRLEQCDEFVARKLKLYSALKSIRTGNLVVIEDFFRQDSFYYIVTDKIDKSDNLSPVEISALSDEKKLLLIKSILYSVMVLHNAGIVHADIKPENILIKKTVAGYYTAKIIDFDASFFEEDGVEEILGDQVYLAPESRLKMMDESVLLTTKVDIFALGILFHQYWTGKLPYIAVEYDSVFEAVLEDSAVELDTSIPETLKTIISYMIEKEPSIRPTAKDVLTSLTGFEPNRSNSNNGDNSDITSRKNISSGKKSFYTPDYDS